MLEALFKYTFLQHAVISAILASIACGFIGTIIVEKRLIMMSGGIAHTAFGGIGLGYYLNIEPIIGGLIFSILAALGVPVIQRKYSTSSDILMGMFWSLGMAAGILFIALTPGYPPDMNSYLFGDILAVSKMDLWIIFLLDCVIVTVIFSLFNLFKAFLLDDEFTAVLGVPIKKMDYLLYLLVALTVVILIKIVGIILIIALLTAPTSIAKRLTFDLKKIMIISSFLGVIFCLVGLYLSYLLNIPSGSTIIMVAVFSFLLFSAVSRKVPNL